MRYRDWGVELGFFVRMPRRPWWAGSEAGSVLSLEDLGNIGEFVGAWEARTRVIVETLEQPGIRDWWTRNRHVYMAEFQQAIEEPTARYSPEASP